ncbi:hypothetical protein [Microbispora rosea]|uniref:hypothetical protein n=1 Tax=Microbispora rosea TaxID=58117 RepID=UPI003D8A594F
MHRNEVVLAGRLSMEPAHRELPSGALLTQWRLAVRRPAGRSGRQRSDAIECATIDDGVRGMLAGWQLDDLVEVEGALRRRWWRGGSRYEIEVRTARRVEPAAPRGRPPRRTTPHADDGAAARVREAVDATEAVDAVKPEAVSSGDGAVGSPAASSCDHQGDAVSAEPADEVVSQWRRSA